MKAFEPIPTSLQMMILLPVAAFGYAFEWSDVIADLDHAMYHGPTSCSAAT